MRSGAKRAYLEAMWSLTVSEARPLARRRASTLRPLGVAILSRKPCLLTLLRLEGWNVLFIACIVFRFYFQRFSERKFTDNIWSVQIFFENLLFNANNFANSLIIVTFVRRI